MARLNNPVIQYFTNEGATLPNGTLEFFENGTFNPKDVFSDADLTIPLGNIINIDSSGKLPNFYTDGLYRVTLKDSEAVTQTQWPRDDVGFLVSGPLSEWNIQTSYDEFDIVQGSDGRFYQSLNDANQGNNPVTSPSDWQEIRYLNVWNVNVTYEEGDNVVDSDGNFWKSSAGSNTGNDPSSTTGFWDPAVEFPDENPFAPTFLSGLQTQADVADVNKRVIVGAGFARNLDNDTNIKLNASIKKRIDSTWVEGDDVGGLASALVLSSDTWYHLFVIGDDLATKADVGWDIDLNAINLLSDAAGDDYTKFRRIRSYLTNGSSNFRQTFQFLDTFQYSDVTVQEFDQTGPDGSDFLPVLSTPLGIVTESICNITLLGPNDTHAYISSPDFVSQNPSLLGNPGATMSTADLQGTPGGFITNTQNSVRTMTNTSSEISIETVIYNVGAGTMRVTVTTIGWIDVREKA